LTLKGVKFTYIHQNSISTFVPSITKVFLEPEAVYSNSKSIVNSGILSIA